MVGVRFCVTDAEEKISNFTLAECIYQVCESNDDLDVRTVANMLLEQHAGERRKLYEKRRLECENSNRSE